MKGVDKLWQARVNRDWRFYFTIGRDAYNLIDITATRQTGYISNFWKALVRSPGDIVSEYFRVCLHAYCTLGRRHKWRRGTPRACATSASF
jgi:hypothetical protein